VFALLLLASHGARAADAPATPRSTDKARDPEACSAALALCEAMDAERVACSRGAAERCRTFLDMLRAVTGPGKAGVCNPADWPPPIGVVSELVATSCDQLVYGHRKSFLREAFPELLRLRKVKGPGWLRNSALDLFYDEEFRERLQAYPDLERLHRRELGYAEVRVQALPRDPGDCDEVRATELARESARARGFAVERMHVAKLFGPTVWARFVEAEPRYATDHDAQREAVGSRSFFYVALRYPPRPSQLPEPGKAGVAIIPIGGSGHGVWVDSFTCELLEYLSGI